MRKVIVTALDFQMAENAGTVIILTGTDEDSGDRITFAGDFRPVQRLYSAVAEEGQVTVELEEYMVLGLRARTDNLVDAMGVPNGQLGWLIPEEKRS